MNQKSLWVEGISDAVGFLGGALIGFWAGRLLGLETFEGQYTNSALGGLALIAVCGGLGLQLARRWRAVQARRAATAAEALPAPSKKQGKDR